MQPVLGEIIPVKRCTEKFRKFHKKPCELTGDPVNHRRIVFPAGDVVMSLGRPLQRQQQSEPWNSVSVFLKDQPDPAESNPELESMLQNNAMEYRAHMQNVNDSFAEWQIAKKSVAEEVQDEDVNKSWR